MKNNFCSEKLYILAFLVIVSATSGQLYAWQGGTHSAHETEEAMTLTPNAERGKQLYAVCATCHFDNGWGDGSEISRQAKPGHYPQLSGQHPNVLIKQIADIRAGNRDNPIMYPFTLDKYIGNAQAIADVTAYITTLPVNTNNNIGYGNDLVRGKEIYMEHCTNCHGDNGEGSNKDFYPRIQGQHYQYLLRQLLWIRDGRRRNANPKMVQQINDFTHRDMMAVSDYVSRMKPPASPKPETGIEKTEKTTVEQQEK